MLKTSKAIAAITAAAALGASGVAFAADGPTQISVQTVPSLVAGQTSPFDAAGVKAIRAGKGIPRGYELIGQQVTIKRGAKTAGAALTFRCRAGKTLRTFATQGQAGFSATRDYVGRRQTAVISFGPPNRAESTGTVYAVCR
ncbi:MAG: hypothetical protein QOH46_2855 [Solirubrobacteraceae bacterium]|jgi:hypothetical protein|nr:hypothetical protein [Solirubrobacteraceae bacterium]